MFAVPIHLDNKRIRSVGLSTPEKPIEPKKSPQDASKSLTDAERTDLQRKLANPLDFPPEFRTWLEGFMETVVPTSAALKALAANLAFPVGYFRIIPEDLTANTSEYVWTDSDTGLQFLYCNGAAVSQTTYADLYAKWGASKYAADSGGNFKLPDCRGRSLWFCGTNAACDLGDSDGVTEANRQPKHSHSCDTAAAHSHAYNSSSGAGGYAAGGNTVADTTSLESVGYGGAHTHAVGSGMSGSDAVAHYFIGSLVVRF